MSKKIASICSGVIITLCIISSFPGALTYGQNNSTVEQIKQSSPKEQSTFPVAAVILLLIWFGLFGYIVYLHKKTISIERTQDDE